MKFDFSILSEEQFKFLDDYYQSKIPMTFRAMDRLYNIVNDVYIGEDDFNKLFYNGSYINGLTDLHNKFLEVFTAFTVKFSYEMLSNQYGWDEKPISSVLIEFYSDGSAMTTETNFYDDSDDVDLNDNFTDFIDDLDMDDF